MTKIFEECGFKNKQGRDEYILGSEELASRKTLVNFISRAFTHFWKHTGIDKTIQLKHLRKTYLTALVSKLGNNANLVSSHAGMKVLIKHYINKEALVKDIISKGDAEVRIF